MISFKTLIFLFFLSINLNFESGKTIDNGMPGNPPPVPRSNISVSFLNSINFEILKECNKWLTSKFSTSFLDILKMNVPVIYFNRNFDRHIINRSSQINNFSIYEMVSSKHELEKKLIDLLWLNN